MMQLNSLLPVRVMLVTRHMAGVTLFVITASLALQLDEDQNNDMRRRGIARNRRRIARSRRRISRSRRRIKTGWSLRRRPDLYNLSQIRFVHRSRWFGFGRSRSCCTGQGSGCPGKKGLKYPTVEVLISPDLIITFMVFTLSVRSQLRTSPADCGWRYAKPRQSKLGIILIIVNAHCMYNVHCTFISTCLMKEEKVWQNMAEFDCLVFGQFDL